jgi:very-short-patch-repair endonuclease
MKVKCANCGKTIHRFPYRIRPFNYCSAKCQLTFEYAHKLRNPFETTLAAHRAIKKYGLPSRRGKPSWNNGLTKFDHPSIKRLSDIRKLNNPMWRFPVRVKRAKTVSKFYRNHPTPEEQILFDSLKKKGLKFIFQYPLGSYILDFAFLKQKLDIEIDNPHHWGKQKRNLAEKRDQWLKQRGWNVLRFKGSEIRQNLNHCLHSIFIVSGLK